MDIDWSKAPAGTTHWDPVDKNHLRQYGKTSQYWNIERGWSDKGCQYPDDLSTMDRLIAKPLWNGESLPPAGTVCERRTHADAEDGRYEEVKIIAYTSSGFPVWENTDAMFSGISKAPHMVGGYPEFRRIRTPEEIAAEDKNSAVIAMCDVIHECGSHDLLPQMVALYEAGYRKQVSE